MGRYQMPKRITGRYERVTAGGEKVDELGILVETTGKKRDRTFAYHAYMERLRTGTELSGSG